jgi:hypothetical protein
VSFKHYWVKPNKRHKSLIGILLTEYDCQWDKRKHTPKAIENLQQYAHPFESPQPVLFDPQWVRDPLELGAFRQGQEKKAAPREQQLRLYLGLELVQGGRR